MVQLFSLSHLPLVLLLAGFQNSVAIISFSVLFAIVYSCFFFLNTFIVILVGFRDRVKVTHVSNHHLLIGYQE